MNKIHSPFVQDLNKLATPVFKVSVILKYSWTSQVLIRSQTKLALRITRITEQFFNWIS